MLSILWGLIAVLAVLYHIECALPDVSHKAAGIACSDKNDLDCAIHEFRKGLDQEPGDAKGWNNLGVALMRKYAPEKDEERLTEALEAFQTSHMFSEEEGTKKNWMSLTGYMKKKGLKVSHETIEEATAAAVKKQKKAKKAKESAKIQQTAPTTGETVSTGNVDTIKMEKRFNEGEFKKALKSCKPSLLTVALSQQEMEGKRLNADTLITLSRVLKVCGVVVLKDALPTSFLQRVVKRQRAQFSGYLSKIAQNEQLTNTTEANQRSPGRYELRLPMTTPYTNDEILLNPYLTPLLKQNIGARYEIDTFSSVTSIPGAPDQHWHQDTSSLFPGSGQHNPAHGLVVFIPIVDVPVEMGPTEYMLGTHITCAEEEKIQRHTKSGWVLRLCPHIPENAEYAPALSAGSMAIFDVRILHRGTKNTSPDRRPMLYISFFREWYTDRVNFKDKQTKKFDSLTAAERKLLSRVDAHQYINQLEEELRKLGADLATLQSTESYSKYNME